MINAGDIQKAFGIKIYNSSKMNSNMTKWLDLYTDNYRYENERIKNIGLPLAVSSEFARLAMTEFSCSLKNPSADRDFQKFANNLRNAVETGCAVGGLVFKPYISNGKIYTDIVKQTDFFPVRYNSYGITAAVLPEQITVGNDIYTRLEYHDYNEYDGTHSIYNKCYCSSDVSALGSECSLKSVPEWSGLKEKHIFYNVPSPLFSFFKTPLSNIIDFNSPHGISVFANAVEQIKQADEHWERILWEFESSERAIDATEDIFRMKDGKPQLPKGRERMFRTYDIMPSEDRRPFIETFSPEIRDSSLFNGFNKILQRIEFNCGLAYGTISDPSLVEKTAEEVKTSKQRSYTNICMVQQNLKSALENLAASYGYFTSSDCSLTCTFGDSVLEDTEKEFQRRMQMVSAGILSKEQYAYINACNLAYMKITSGAFSYQEAIRQAIQSAAQQGATVLYPSGHTDRIDVAVRRAVLTGVGQTCRTICEMNAVEMGCDLMELSAHSGARPDHAEWQGQLVSLSGRKGYLTKDDIGYGTGAGFGGWNCRHDWFPYFEGISTRNYTEKALKQMNAKCIEYNGKKYTEYEISQIQRRMEREIRSAKREKVAYMTAVTESDGELKAVMEDALKYANSLVRVKQAKMRDFISQTGQQRQYFREQNYGRVSYSNRLTSVSNGGKMKTGGKITDKNFMKADNFEKQAARYYNERLKDDTDVSAIAKNTEFSENDIQKIKNHMMSDTILFKDGTLRKFDPDIDQALAWKRLIEGENIKEADILMLKHELEETIIMETTGAFYEDAHNQANKKYNWQDEKDKFIDNDNLY